jgi:uncharacterized protein YjiS (DUF1127 family)
LLLFQYYLYLYLYISWSWTESRQKSLILKEMTFHEISDV